MSDPASDHAEVFSPVTLPCSGRAMSNRLVKVALYEHLASMYGGPPNKYHMRLYTEWAKHNWGMIVTGNVQVSRDHLSLGRDTVLPETLNEQTLAPFKELARTIHASNLDAPLSARPLAVMQLSHSGRQSPNFFGGRKFGIPPLAPSPVRLGSDARVRSQCMPHPYMLALFQQPRQMSTDDIKCVQQAFIKGAVTALESGFDGVELHCAHGYLLAQFLNPKSNIRRDEYSIESDNALRMVGEIVEGIRAVVPKNFVVGVKISSADFVGVGKRDSDEKASEQSRRVLSYICTMARWRMIDFIEISGGDYESPDFVSTKETSPRQALFARFAHMAREYLRDLPPGSNVPLILLTGGLRSPAHLQVALEAGHADLLGIGRGAIVRPNIPALLLDRISSAASIGSSIVLDDEPFTREPGREVQIPSWVPLIPLVGAGAGVAWYSVYMRRIAVSPFEEVNNKIPRMSGIEAILKMLMWVEWHECQRFIRWLYWCVPSVVLGILILFCL